jgi:hypothetical protein
MKEGEKRKRILMSLKSWIQIGIKPKMQDPDSDQESINPDPDPKHWCSGSNCIRVFIFCLFGTGSLYRRV